MRRCGAAVLSTLLLLAACGGSGDGPPTDGEVVVSAVASLTDAFADLVSSFEAEHPGTDVVLNLAGSSSLRRQILEGAPVDVFAPADRSNMDRLVDAGEVAGEPALFAGNSLQIAVPAGNPAGVAGLEDLARPELLVGLCAEGVPCGDFARTVLSRAGVEPSIDTNEPDVRALLTKIAAGELDAGITYVTDVASTGGSVEGVDIPADLNAAVGYEIAVLGGAPNPDAAAAFVAYVLSDRGRSILGDYGFSSP